MSEEEIWSVIEKERDKMQNVQERLARGSETFQGISNTLGRLESFLNEESQRGRDQDAILVKLTERLKICDDRMEDHVGNHWKWATITVALAGVFVAAAVGFIR